MRLKQRKQLYLLIEGLPMEEMNKKKQEVEELNKIKIKIYLLYMQTDARQRETERESERANKKGYARDPSKKEKPMVNYIYNKAKTNRSKWFQKKSRN